MPSGFGALDTGFPDLSGMDTEQKIKSIEDYLYQLMEQLRYTLHNLDSENFNQEETAQWIEGSVKNLDATTIKVKNLTANAINADGTVKFRGPYEGDMVTGGTIKGYVNDNEAPAIEINNGPGLLIIGADQISLKWLLYDHPLEYNGYIWFGEDGGFNQGYSKRDDLHSTGSGFDFLVNCVLQTLSFNYDNDNLSFDVEIDGQQADISLNDTHFIMTPETITVSRTKNGVTTTYDLFDKLGQI